MFMRVVGVGEEVAMFVGPDLGEVGGELFNGDGIIFKIEHVDEVFVELYDDGVMSCGPV